MRKYNGTPPPFYYSLSSTPFSNIPPINATTQSALSAAPPQALLQLMKPLHTVVLVTAPNLRVARSLARAALSARLVACVNLLPGLESHYWWDKRITSGREILLLLKTPRSRLPALERLIVKQHPYHTPEFIALPISRGNRRYLDWISSSVRVLP